MSPKWSDATSFWNASEPPTSSPPSFAVLHATADTMYEGTMLAFLDTPIMFVTIGLAIANLFLPKEDKYMPYLKVRWLAPAGASSLTHLLISSRAAYGRAQGRGCVGTNQSTSIQSPV